MPRHGSMSDPQRVQLSSSVALPSYVRIPDIVHPSGIKIPARQLMLSHCTPPRNDEELWHYCLNYFGVAIPVSRCCPKHVSPFRAFADAYFARHSMIVWKASRGLGGKSMLLALLALVEQVTLGASVSLLGGSGEQSKRVHKYMTGEDPNVRGKFWESPLAPRWLLKDPPTQTETRLTNGGFLKTLMASQTSIRGPHPQRLRLDECDEMDWDIFEGAMGQTMAANGIAAQTVMSSTHQYPDGTMTKILKMAAEAPRPWLIYEWCYRENLEWERGGWLAPSEVERKRNEVSAMMWAVEYEMQEPSPEGRVIDADAVRNLFQERVGVYTGNPNTSFRKILPGNGDYYHGADWAKTQDWTVLQTNWRNPKGPDFMAAWSRSGRQKWPLMIGMLNDRIAAYGGPCIHDSTGVGDVCHDYLEHDATGFDFRAVKRRQEMLTNYIAAIERGDLIYPMIGWMFREHLYATYDELYGNGHLPDSISAGAMAWMARESEWVA